jgi:DGQHR domain-containing protein
MSAHGDTAISVHALRVKQPAESHLILFSLTAEQLQRVSSVSRLGRNEQGKLEGYQRSIAEEHVRNIADYLSMPEALMPHAVIVALSSAVRFEERRGPGNDDGSAIAGRLTIPIPRTGEAPPAWIVDGQQRLTALSRLADQSFPVPMAGFVTDSIELQRDQFIRVNSVKPLDKGLVTELLPEVVVPLSPRLSAKKVPSALVDLLNSAEDSPFKGLVRRPSSPSRDRRIAPVQDTSLVAAIQESLSTTSGCLFPYRNLASGHTDHEAIWWFLLTFWTSVRDAFPEAWGLPPTQSRLMHGCGIRAMGRLMDRMMASATPFSETSAERVRHEMATIAPFCHWTDGTWSELNGLAWNELQNTPRHIRMLSNALIRTYLQHRQDLP